MFIARDHQRVERWVPFLLRGLSFPLRDLPAFPGREGTDRFQVGFALYPNVGRGVLVCSIQWCRNASKAVDGRFPPSPSRSYLMDLGPLILMLFCMRQTRCLSKVLRRMLEIDLQVATVASFKLRRPCCHWHFCLKPYINHTKFRKDADSSVLTSTRKGDFVLSTHLKDTCFQIDQVYLIYKAPMPLSAHARPRETRYWLQCR